MQRQVNSVLEEEVKNLKDDAMNADICSDNRQSLEVQNPSRERIHESKVLNQNSVLLKRYI